MCISWSINTYGRRQLSDCSYLATPEPETMSEVSDLGKGKKITGLLLLFPEERTFCMSFGNQGPRVWESKLLEVQWKVSVWIFISCQPLKLIQERLTSSAMGDVLLCGGNVMRGRQQRDSFEFASLLIDMDCSFTVVWSVKVQMGRISFLFRCWR